MFIGVFAFASTASALGYNYVKNIISDNKRLAIEVSTLETSNAGLQETLDVTEANNQRQADLNITLVTQLSETESRLNELRQTFLDHDLTNLALEKPELIERRVNIGTQNVFDAIERDTSR